MEKAQPTPFGPAIVPRIVPQGATMADSTDIPLVARLAREAGAWFANDECECCHEVTFTDTADLARFAALVAEECAKVCEETVVAGAYRSHARLAEAIRARFVHSPKPLT
jgi:hypothetical protein